MLGIVMIKFCIKAVLINCNIIIIICVLIIYDHDLSRLCSLLKSDHKPIVWLVSRSACSDFDCYISDDDKIF